jgi:(p)ppGpp synthase/HD superfamily hydrolase
MFRRGTGTAGSSGSPLVSLEAAIEMAVKVHRGQVDKAGEPYILHPLRVMFRIREQGHSVEAQVAAVLHDAVEDTPVTLDDIAFLNPDVAALVDAVTRRPNEAYLDFVRRAASNPEARALKIADIEDNLSRLDRLRPEDTESLGRRYEKALEILRGEDPDPVALNLHPRGSQ